MLEPTSIVILEQAWADAPPPKRGHSGPAVDPASWPDSNQPVRFRRSVTPVIVESLDILYLLDQLEEVLGAGSRVPLTSRTLVDEQEILDILDQIRVSHP